MSLPTIRVRLLRLFAISKYILFAISKYILFAISKYILTVIYHRRCSFRFPLILLLYYHALCLSLSSSGHCMHSDHINRLHITFFCNDLSSRLLIHCVKHNIFHKPSYYQLCGSPLVTHQLCLRQNGHNTIWLNWFL